MTTFFVERVIDFYPQSESWTNNFARFPVWTYRKNKNNNIEKIMKFINSGFLLRSGVIFIIRGNVLSVMKKYASPEIIELGDGEDETLKFLWRFLPPFPLSFELTRKLQRSAIIPFIIQPALIICVERNTKNEYLIHAETLCSGTTIESATARACFRSKVALRRGGNCPQKEVIPAGRKKLADEK